MVADLVHEHMAYELAKRSIAAIDPLCKDWLTVEMYVIGLSVRIVEGPARQVDAFIKAGQFERILNSEIIENLVFGEIGDMQHDIAAQRAKLRRQRRIGLLRELIDFLKAWRAPVGPQAFHCTAS
jgi:hypothetical protein